MLFNAPEFAVFLAGSLLAYWALARTRTVRLWFLLAASYYFYACWDARFLALMGGVSLVDWAAGLLMARLVSARARGLLCAVVVGLNLGQLGFWKYTGFLLENLRAPLAALGLSAPAGLDIVLPVGISFFTFQGLSYVIDVYRRDLPAERSLLRVALYIAFFPQLVAGPIVRARDLLGQFDRRLVLSSEQFGRGLELVLSGLVKKVVLADFLAHNLVDRVFDFPERFSSLEVLLAVYAYALQIYADFSGYSDIAIGVARLFGFELADNFRLPYRADGLRDFWRRWHISLSTWLRDYLYVPLGGSRHGLPRMLLALLLTMLFGGLWHGASWTFVWWGALHGTGLVCERLWQRLRGGRTLLPRALRIALTLHFVLLGWIVFRSPDLSTAAGILGRIADLDFAGQNLGLPVVALVAGGFVVHYLPERWRESFRRLFVRSPALGQAAATILVLYLVRALAASAPAPFIYFQF